MDSEFEKRLQHRPLKRVPGEWRAEILAAARAARTSHEERNAADSNRSWLSTINSQLSTLLWPHPKAWAGLAGVWMCIAVLNFSMREKPAMIAEAKASPPPSPEMVAELKQQQKMMAELIGAGEMRVADRQRTVLPKPRSEREEIRIS
jgi:hypothetical protein